jgi:hypothetical protein
MRIKWIVPLLFLTLCVAEPVVAQQPDVTQVEDIVITLDPVPPTAEAATTTQPEAKPPTPPLAVDDATAFVQTIATTVEQAKAKQWGAFVISIAGLLSLLLSVVLRWLAPKLNPKVSRTISAIIAGLGGVASNMALGAITDWPTIILFGGGPVVTAVLAILVPPLHTGEVAMRGGKKKSSAALSGTKSVLLPVLIALAMGAAVSVSNTACGPEFLKRIEGIALGLGKCLADCGLTAALDSAGQAINVGTVDGTMIGASAMTCATGCASQSGLQSIVNAIVPREGERGVTEYTIRLIKPTK